MEGLRYSSLASVRVETFLEEMIGFAVLKRKQGFKLVSKKVEYNYVVLELQRLQRFPKMGRFFENVVWGLK